MVSDITLSKNIRFQVVVDSIDMTDDDYRRMIVFIKSNRFVDDWHSPFRGFFIISSNAKIEDLAENLAEFFTDGRKFHVTQIVAGNNLGFLAQETWDWFDKFNSESSEVS